MIDIIERKPEKSVQEIVSLKERPKKEVKNYEVDKVELSKNIQEFDKKPRVYTKDPYAYNEVSLKKDTEFSLTAQNMITDPLYNMVGKSLGVDTIHDWNRYYDKVQEIVEWAKKETGYKDKDLLVSWIYGQVGKTTSLGAKRIDDLYIYSKLKQPKREIKFKPKVKTKVVVKYVKEKLTTEDMVKRLIKG